MFTAADYDNHIAQNAVSISYTELSNVTLESRERIVKCTQSIILYPTLIS